MSVATIPFPRSLPSFSQDCRSSPFVARSNPGVSKSKFAEPFLGGSCVAGGRVSAPIVPPALPLGLRYLAAQQLVTPPAFAAASKHFESPTRSRGAVLNRMGSQQLSSNYRGCNPSLNPSQVIVAPTQFAGQKLQLQRGPLAGNRGMKPELSKALSTAYGKNALDQPCRLGSEGEAFFEAAGKSTSPRELAREWQRQSQQSQQAKGLRIPISTPILSGTPVLTTLSPARDTNGDVRHVAVERLYQLLAVPQKPLRSNANHTNTLSTIAAMVPTAEDSTKPKPIEDERRVTSPVVRSSIVGNSGDLRISVPDSSGLLGSPITESSTEELSPSAAAGNSGRRVFCIGTRCDHIESWKRLRAKKGTAYYILPAVYGEVAYHFHNG